MGLRNDEEKRLVQTDRENFSGETTKDRAKGAPHLRGIVHFSRCHCPKRVIDLIEKLESEGLL